MVRERFEQKKGRIVEYIQLLRSLEKDCIERFDIDPIYRGALLHYLYLTADSCISIAEIVIKHKRLRPPQTYSEAIDILGDHNILEPEFAYSFARIAGFRNFLAHDYEMVDGKRICATMLHGLDDVEQYLAQIEKALA